MIIKRCILNPGREGGALPGHVARYRQARLIAEYIQTDFAAIAQGFGCQGLHVERPQDIVAAIEKAKTANVPTVIDVTVSRDESYRKVATP